MSSPIHGDTASDTDIKKEVAAFIGPIRQARHVHFAGPLAPPRRIKGIRSMFRYKPTPSPSWELRQAYKHRLGEHRLMPIVIDEDGEELVQVYNVEVPAEPEPSLLPVHQCRTPGVVTEEDKAQEAHVQAVDVALLDIQAGLEIYDKAIQDLIDLGVDLILAGAELDDLV